MNVKEKYERLNKLLDKLAMWPEWQLNSMLLDESDLEVKKMVMARKEMYHMMLTNYLNEKIDYSAIKLNISPCESDKKLIK